MPPESIADHHLLNQGVVAEKAFGMGSLQRSDPAWNACESDAVQCAGGGQARCRGG